ncbi:MAG: threonylcarbamoyl-AMP synthase [Clostridia bacterium]|nr:threonylcarbamoyl-AMP synthase [Clostridia bacterium]
MILAKTEILKVSKNADTAEDIEKLKFASDVIKRGGLCVFPTETVYGLGADSLNEKAVKSIYEAKGRPQNNPLIIHLSDKRDIEKYCETKGVFGLDKLTDLMPAPLTVILRAKDTVPKTTTGGLDTVAFRIPANNIARKLIELSGTPIAAPSANISGKPSPTGVKDVIEDMDSKVDVIIDGGECDIGIESTIITLCETPPVLLRPGKVSFEKLCELLGEVNMSHAVLDSLKPGEKILSPGMAYKHYAPDKPVFLLKGSTEKKINYVNEKNKTEKTAVICYESDRESINCKDTLCAGSENDNEAYAAKLFSLLRKTDKLDVDKVYAFLPKDTHGISLAIYNRLMRAAAFNVINLE